MTHILGETLKRKWDNRVEINEERWELVGLQHKIPTMSISHMGTRLGEQYKEVLSIEATKKHARHISQ